MSGGPTVTQRTPGPWTTDPECGHESVLGPDDCLVADCGIWGLVCSRSQATNVADARLVAAAPDLLYRAERLLDWMERARDPDSSDRDLRDRLVRSAEDNLREVVESLRSAETVT